MKFFIALLFSLFCLSAHAEKYSYGLVIPKDWKSRGTFKEIPKKASFVLPATWDWRSKVALSEVRSQGSCGSCWAFSSVSTFRDAMTVQGGLVGDGSEEWVLSCNQYGYGCQGGFFDIAGMYVNQGMVRERDFAAYVGAPVRCTPTASFDKLAEWHYVPLGNNQQPSTENMKQAIYTYGPINAGLAAGGAGWSSYKGGVYSGDCSDRNLNHAIEIVGWDDTKGSGVWIIRNSWGSSWGDKGYIYLPYNCDGVGESAVYYIYKGSVPPPPNPDPDPTPTPTPPPTPPGPCTLPTASTGHSSSFTATAGKQVIMGVKGKAGVTYEWAASPPFDGSAIPRTAQISYKPRITKTLTVTATNECGKASASSLVVIPNTDEYYE